MRRFQDLDASRIGRMITVRPLQTIEWEAFRSLRLQALSNAPGSFTTSFEEAAARSQEDWIRLIAGPGHQVFGLFDSQIVGLSGVFAVPSDPATAEFVMSYIKPDYRGLGLSQLLFQAKLQWAAANGFKRVVLSHRASNRAAARVAQKNGFQQVKSVSRTWPDRAVEDEIVMELMLAPPGETFPGG
jgi:RimJ/RimL family protein N-acetyltransferase